MIHITFTCKGRPALTELCLRRLVELMPPPYNLHICYDGYNDDYIDMLQKASPRGTKITYNPSGNNRFTLINDALIPAEAEYYMHVENDFYWVNPMCLDSALSAFYFTEQELDYIRFEHLPFTHRAFYRYENYDGRDICWMRDGDYRFTFNPHIRRFKYPNDEPFQTTGFTKQPEQHHNDGYKYQSACMTGDNWRHLGIYSEGGHYKPYYGERFYNKRGKHITSISEVINTFGEITDNPTYLRLFGEYLHDNGN